jgi:hypothetical protein
MQSWPFQAKEEYGIVISWTKEMASLFSFGENTGLPTSAEPKLNRFKSYYSASGNKKRKVHHPKTDALVGLRKKNEIKCKA